MNLTLTRFLESDLNQLDAWCKNIQADQFMSRVTPRRFKRGSSVQNDLWDWYVIKHHGQSIGTVWLEKNEVESDMATLGILLGSFKFFGQGMGVRAILLAIETSQRTLGYKKVRLNVRKSNPRAISCYKKCGFSIVREDVKINQEQEEISFYRMQRDV